MKRIITITALSLIVLICGCDNKVYTDNKSVNKWVYEKFKDNYLWKNSLGSYGSGNLELSPDAFLDKVIRYRTDPSIALAGDFSGDRFSYAKLKESESRSLDKTDVNDYGLIMVPTISSQQGAVLSIKPLYVVPGSPADQAGIKRGDIFVGINGKTMPITQSVYNQEKVKSSQTLTYQGTGRTITITKASYKDTPVFCDSVYSSSIGAVGYLVYNHFTAGDKGVFTQQVERVFQRFRSRGVKNLILDLRYNTGGEVEAARKLASYIVRREQLSKTFIYTETASSLGNPAKFSPMNFSSATDLVNTNIDCQGLYIITSGNTASASELVIHGLRPFYNGDMVVVGSVTHGKNIGGIKITSKNYLWELYVMTLRIYDINKVSGYEQGISPNYFAVESISQLHDFGDKEDPLLAKVFSVIEGTSLYGNQTAPSRAISDERWVVDIPDRGNIVEEIIEP